MISFDEFISKYDGKPLDFDSSYGPQCMDLMHYYCVEVLGISDRKVLAAPTAAAVFNNFDSIYGRDLFEKIVNTPTGVPQKGDILFWNTSIGSAGHVAIFIEGDAKSFKSFDQNWPAGSVCHKQDHTYKGLAGWIRRKEPIMADKVTISGTEFKILVQKATQWDSTAEAFSVDKLDEGGAKKVVAIVNDLKNNLSNLNTTVGKLESDLATAKKQVEDLESRPPEIKEVIKEVPVTVVQNVDVGHPTTIRDLWIAIRYYLDFRLGGGEK